MVQPPAQSVACLCMELLASQYHSIQRQPASQVGSTAVGFHSCALDLVCVSPEEALPQTSQQPGLHLREGAVDLVCDCRVVLGLTQHITPSLQVPCSCLHVHSAAMGIIEGLLQIHQILHALTAAAASAPQAYKPSWRLADFEKLKAGTAIIRHDTCWCMSCCSRQPPG